MSRDLMSSKDISRSVKSTSSHEARSKDIIRKQSATSVKSAHSRTSNPERCQCALTSVSSTLCRICHANSTSEHLISPCNCKGTLAYVHMTCLERWLNESSRNYCELCMFHYDAVQTLRYGFWEGILTWVRHPRNRMHVQSDVLICVLLTIVTGGLVSVCVLGMQYFVMEGKKVGISKAWTKGSVCFFLGIIVLGYLITLYLVIKDQVVPWYRWWRNTFNVRLLLSPSTLGFSETIV
ncbi:E3 ubiquitin-protein ligase MARCH2-like [Photinus pyralis]|uniref:E3 ubiquitin-protein ligase MARCH2-like n=1 Tax=Photinus pyralis TaxID=7054 RepID=UPI0012672AB7|nr:E3 ubiquitin-protein ligase MARCH2-like [Photinus pyralis]